MPGHRSGPPRHLPLGGRARNKNAPQCPSALNSAPPRPAANLPGSVVAEPSRRCNRRHHCRTAVATNATPSGLTFSHLRSICRSGKTNSRVARWFFSIAGRRVANRSPIPMAATPSGSLAPATVRSVRKLKRHGLGARYPQTASDGRASLVLPL